MLGRRKSQELGIVVLLTLVFVFLFYTDSPSLFLGSYCRRKEFQAVRLPDQVDHTSPSISTGDIRRYRARGAEHSEAPKITGEKEPPKRSVPSGRPDKDVARMEVMSAPDAITKSMIKPCNGGDPLCTQYLSEEDYEGFFKHCKGRHARVYNKSLSEGLTSRGCRFLNGSTKRAPVALISFAGSGNTWVRGLLEQATGICTGSVYCDVSLLASGMYGESVRSGSVLVVKTHHRLKQEWTVKKKLEFGKNGDPKWSAAILIVRNPFEALVSEWNRRGVVNGTGNNHHVAVHGPEFFVQNEEWNKFVSSRAQFWKELISNWYISGHPVLVVKYNDLKSDALREIKRMLDFLNFPYTDEEVSKRMATTFDTFHRSSHAEFEHYTPEQRANVNRALQETVELLKEQNGGNTLGIEEFLSK